jgi:hypothetical protein
MVPTAGIVLLLRNWLEDDRPCNVAILIVVLGAGRIETE